MLMLDRLLTDRLINLAMQPDLATNLENAFLYSLSNVRIYKSAQSISIEHALDFMGDNWTQRLE